MPDPSTILCLCGRRVPSASTRAGLCPDCLFASGQGQLRRAVRLERLLDALVQTATGAADLLNWGAEGLMLTARQRLRQGCDDLRRLLAETEQARGVRVSPGCDRCGRSSGGLDMGQAATAGWWFTPPTAAPDAPDAYCPECAAFLKRALREDSP